MLGCNVHGVGAWACLLGAAACPDSRPPPLRRPPQALWYWWLQIAIGIGVAALCSTFVFPITAGGWAGAGAGRQGAAVAGAGQGLLASLACQSLPPAATHPCHQAHHRTSLILHPHPDRLFCVPVCATQATRCR